MTNAQLLIYYTKNFRTCLLTNNIVPYWSNSVSLYFQIYCPRLLCRCSLLFNTLKISIKINCKAVFAPFSQKYEDIQVFLVAPAGQLNLKHRSANGHMRKRFNVLRWPVHVTVLLLPLLLDEGIPISDCSFSIHLLVFSKTKKAETTVQ